MADRPVPVTIEAPSVMPVRIVNPESVPSLPMPPVDDLERRDQRHPSVVQAPNNLPYIVAVVLMMLMGVAGVAAIVILRPQQDNAAIIASIIGLLAPTTLSLLAFMKAQETHLSVNSRLDAFMRNAEFAARVQGVMDGRAQGRQDANDRTDQISAQGPK